MPSVKSNFSLKAEDVERVRGAISRVGTNAESVVNDYLHNVAGEKIAKSVTEYIPTSEKGRKHAKKSKWYKQNNYNGAVVIENKTTGTRGNSFYYLYYVATSTGTSKPKKKKDGTPSKGGVDFMQKGMDDEYKNIVNGLVETLDNAIDKELK